MKLVNAGMTINWVFNY